MKFILITLCLLSLIFGKSRKYYFNLYGGPQYMYYFAVIKVGTPSQEQSVIVDTGSDTFTFPCSNCNSNNCGRHKNNNFNLLSSATLSPVTKEECNFGVFNNRFLFSGNNNNYTKSNCDFKKAYAEGSELYGSFYKDQVNFSFNKERVLKETNKVWGKKRVLKIAFGCTYKETGLFVTQYANGIMGLDDTSEVFQSIERYNSVGSKISFSLCIGRENGHMVFGGWVTKKHLKNEITQVIKYSNGSGNSYYEIYLSKIKVGYRYIPVKNKLMIDSGTTFTHMPSEYVSFIISQIKYFCSKNRLFHGKRRCGGLRPEDINQNLCMQYTKPDDNFMDEYELLSSFPKIKLILGHGLRKKIYILHPNDYFYKQHNNLKYNNPNYIGTYCFSIKEESSGKIILGAFGMVNYDIHFNREKKLIKYKRANCNSAITPLPTINSNNFFIKNKKF